MRVLLFRTYTLVLTIAGPASTMRAVASDVTRLRASFALPVAGIVGVGVLGVAVGVPVGVGVATAEPLAPSVALVAAALSGVASFFALQAVVASVIVDRATSQVRLRIRISM